MGRKKHANAPNKNLPHSPKIKKRQNAPKKPLKRSSKAPHRPLGTNLAKSTRTEPIRKGLPCKNRANGDADPVVRSRINEPIKPRKGLVTSRTAHNKNVPKRPKRARKKGKAAKSKLPSKETPSLTLKQQQKIWYAKLAEDGFQDLERLYGIDGLDGLLSSRGSQPTANFAEAAFQGRDTYYRRLTNFVTHNPNWSGVKLYNLMSVLYVEGVSYRDMLPILEKRCKKKTNIWRIHKVIKDLETRAKVWNKTHPEGLDFEADLNLQPGIIMGRRDDSSQSET